MRFLSPNNDDDDDDNDDDDDEIDSILELAMYAP
jgi:hypothetical protein